MSLASGVRLNNRFTLLELVGAGGMSQVWRARDDILGRPVAVKVLTATLAADPALRTAVRAEARAAARLTHPHVTQVYDYGESVLPGGERVPYLVLELVEGQSLADRLRFGPLPWPQAVTVAAEVASALAAAHRLGVVHRDVKPGNVMLTPAGVKVLDFGIAALVGGPPAADGGRLVGTPTYAAPERLRPAPAVPASDVYALGVLLYQALTGRVPVPVASWQQAAAAHRSGVPVAAPEVAGLPDRVRQLCLACLAPEPADRPSAAELERGLAAAAGAPTAVTATMPIVGGPPPGGPALAGHRPGFPPPSHPPTLIDPGLPALGRHPAAAPGRRLPRSLLVLLAAAVVALTAVALLVRAGQHSGGSPPAAQAPTSAPASAPASPTPSVASSAATPTDTSPEAILSQLDATVAAALAAGRIDADTASSLRDKIDDLRASHGKNKARRQARELQQRIDELLADAKIDQQTADQLSTLLQALRAQG